jgi:hypothetical protein
MLVETKMWVGVVSRYWVIVRVWGLGFGVQALGFLI